MKYLCPTLLLCLMFACQQAANSGWKTIDYGPFKLKAPQEWEKVKIRGVDSYVGGLTNGTDTLIFDYGNYSPHVEPDSLGVLQEDTINGLSGVIGMSGDTANPGVQMEIYLKNETDRFFISGHHLKDVSTALKIFKTIYFPYGDTTVNPVLVMEKFHPGVTTTGHELYLMNCASCHNHGKALVGPPFTEILSHRDEDWIYRFLTNRESITPDSLTIAYRKNAGDMECVRFPELTRIELTRILGYIK